MANKAVGLLTFNFGANLQGFERAMNKAQKKLKKFGRNVEQTGKSLTLGFTLPLGALAVTAVKTASDLEEVQSKFDTVFSSIASSAERAAARFADAFKMSELETKTLLSNTGDLLVGFGFSEEAALKLSLQVNELAVDLASFNNLQGGAAQASEALTKGLLGERESMKTLGIAIKESDLKEFAEQQGFVWKETDRATRAQLTYELALQQSSKAVGDRQRTMDSFAGVVRTLKGEFSDVSATIGKILLPMAEKLANFLMRVFKRFESLSPSMQNFIVTAGLVVGALGPLLIVIGRVSTGIAAIIPVIKTAVKALKAMKLSWLGIGAAIGGALVALGNYIFKKKKQKKEVDAVNDAMVEAEKNIQSEIVDVRVLTDVLEDHNSSLKDKEKALNKLKEISPEYYGHLDAAKLTMEDLNNASERYISNLRRQAQAEAMRSKIIELEQKKLDLVADARKKFDISDDMSDADLIDFLEESQGQFMGLAKAYTDEINTAETQIQRLLNSLVEIEKAGNNTGIGFKMITDHLKSLSVEQLRNMGLTDEYIKSLGKVIEKTEDVTDIDTPEQTPFEIDLEEVENKYEEAVRLIKEKRLKNEIDDKEFKERLEKAEIDHLKNLQTLGEQYKKDLLSTQEIELLTQETEEAISLFERLMGSAGSSFENLVSWTKKLSDAQKLSNAGWEMFGDILTSSLDSAISSQENFFNVFIENIKKAIRQLLIQLAVMTLIKALMGGGSAAFSLANLKANLATIMGVQLAEGGLATGPTAALVGEGPNTSISNPEVIAPLDKLKQYMGGGNVEVTGVIRGNDIYLSNEKTRFNRSRTV